MKNSLEFLSVGGGLESQKNLTVFDLETLSASQFYTGDLPSMSAAGAFIKGGNKEIDWSIPSGYEFKSAPYVDKTPIKALNLSALKTVEKFDILDKPKIIEIPKLNGFGKDFGLNKGYVFDALNLPETNIPIRIRTDKSHQGYEFPHLNLEFYNGKNTKPWENDHIKLDWNADE